MKNKKEQDIDEGVDEAPRQLAAEDEEPVAARDAAADLLALQSMSRDELAGELEMARAEVERLQDQSLRRQADLVNFRRRAQKEQSELAAVSQARLLEALVPVIDDFERAVDAESKDARAYHEGMQLILRRVQQALEQIGVERLEPRGEAFDPRYHEAIARHQTDDVPAGCVFDVYRPGYRLKDRLIRPASVVVAYADEAAGSEPGEDLATPREEAAAAGDDGGGDDV